MPKTSPKQSGSAFARENPKHWIGVEVEDIPQGWMDDMVKRLFEVLNRDMIRLEAEQISPGNTPDDNLDLEKAAKQSRLLTQMRTNLEKLRKMETKRQAKKPQATVNDDDARAELQRQVDRILAAGDAGKTDRTPSG
jgi:hypothetical protein